MLWPSRKKMTAKKTINRNCLIPNEGGFRPAGSVVFNELAIDLILTTSVNFGAVRQGANCCNIPVTLIDPDDRGFECDRLVSSLAARKYASCCARTFILTLAPLWRNMFVNSIS